MKPVEIKDTGERPHPLVAEIKDALNRCEDRLSVDECARHYAYEVALMEAAGGYLRTMSIQIKNLAVYRRKMLPRIKRKESPPISG